MSVDVPAAVQQMVDATAAQDSDLFVDSFTADARLEDWGRVFDGHDGIRAWNETDNIGQGNQFALKRAKEHDGTWVLRFNAHSNRRRGPGTMRVTLRDNRISRLTISLM